jgi:FtsZ-binding cell division protein ZapB
MDVTFPVAKLSDDNGDKDEEITDDLAAGMILLYSMFDNVTCNTIQLILYVEIRRLKKEVTELRTRCSQLEKSTTDLSRENKKLTNENQFLAKVNEAFATENDELRESVERYSNYRLPKSFRQQGRDERSSKRQKTTKSKGKKPVRVTDDELDDESTDSSSEEHGPEIEEQDKKGARVCV